MTDRTKWTIVGVAGAVLAAVLVVVLLSGSDPDQPTGGEASKASLDPPTQIVEPDETASVVMETSEGSFTIELDTTRAPKTANTFAYLSEEGFYDGLGFHRIVPGFVIQGGDPKGDGSGGPGFKTVERPPADLEYAPGIVAMAKSADEAPGTAGSQFFVVTGEDGSSLPPEYALVGQVSDGFDVVQKIGNLGGADEQPTRDVVIEKATLETG
jgi:cyclophilin family peptidyl-prolyl cis-trans isomerase